MNIYKNPDHYVWQTLIDRPLTNQADTDETVREILATVQGNGDDALLQYTRQFDGVSLKNMAVQSREIEYAGNKIDANLKSAIQLAKSNITQFHQAQSGEESEVETTKGVKCWQKSVPIEKVGLYVPGGSAPLFSTVLMLGIPAKIAGCKEIVLCTPPGRNGRINPAILYTADLIGINKIYKTGGAQAIAAMAYGTASIPAVYKIFGPGNVYVTKAKELVQQKGVAIDMPAGPSELLVIADKDCNPKFVAADLLSQAEHGPDSQVVLLSNNRGVVKQVIAEICEQINRLPRRDIAEKSLNNSFAVILNSMEMCIDFSNRYAPEHLTLAVKEPGKIIEHVINAGSVFIGNYSCEAAGDYATGTNHTLPTNGFAKCYSGLSVESFMKKITFQQISATGLQNIGPAVEQLAEAEGLSAHKNAVTLRLNSLNDG